MIVSKSNEYIKHIKALSQKKYREEYQEFVIEGIKMIQEAMDENIEIKKVLISEDTKEMYPFQEAQVVSRPVFEYISETKTPQGVLAVVSQKEPKAMTGNIIFALDGVQDPGNVGTIMRTLDAAGISHLLLSEGCADIYNAKVVRSTMGAIFRVNTHYVHDLKEEFIHLKEKGYQIVVTSLNDSQSVYKTDFKRKSIIVIGNEAKGVSESIMNLADVKTKIPMLGKTESLNAAVAASILAYETVRQNIES